MKNMRTIDTLVEEELPGIIPEFADLKPGVLLTEEALARIFRRDSTTVKKMVQRGELPPPFKMAGSNCWTAGAIVKHIELGLEAARKDVERIKGKHSP